MVLTLGLAGGVAAVELEPDTAGYEAQILPFMNRYCLECHDEDVQKGDVRFDTLTGDLVRGRDTELWKDILLRLETGEMPPRRRSSRPRRSGRGSRSGSAVS